MLPSVCRRLSPRLLGLIFAWTVFSGLVPSAKSATSEEVGPFFAKPEYSAPVLAPDGKHTAFLAWIANRTRLFSFQLDTKRIKDLSTTEQGDVGAVWWLGSNRLLYWAHNEGGWTYFVRELDGTKPRHLKSLDGWPTNWITVLTNDPVHVMAFHENEVCRVDVEKDKAQILGRTEQGWPVLSADGELRAIVDADSVKKEWTVKWRADANGKWSVLHGDVTKPVFYPVGMARDDRHIIVIAYDQGDTTALMSLDPVSGQRTLLAQRPDRDVSEAIGDSTGRFIIGAEFYSFTGHDRTFLDPADAKRQASIDQAIPGVTNELLSASSDGMLQIVKSSGPSCPPVYSLIDRRQGRISQLGSAYPSLLPKQLGRTESFQFKCSDGLAGYGYVVLPPAGAGRRPAPLLVRMPVNAGDNAQPPVEYVTSDQYLASRGYAVAHLTVRGSDGFGKRFRTAGNFQFADQIPRDIEAGLRRLADSGWIDPKRIAVLGNWRSGLLALRLAAGSNSYRSVITINTPGNLTTQDLRWMYADPIYLTDLVTQVGGNEKARQLIRPFYPESFIAKLNVPALLIYSRYYDGDHLNIRELEYCFRANHKAYDTCEIKPENPEKPKKPNFYEEQVWIKVADYLDKTLK